MEVLLVMERTDGLFSAMLDPSSVEWKAEGGASSLYDCLSGHLQMVCSSE